MHQLFISILTEKVGNFDANCVVPTDFRYILYMIIYV